MVEKEGIAARVLVRVDPTIIAPGENEVRTKCLHTRTNVSHLPLTVQYNECTAFQEARESVLDAVAGLKLALHVITNLLVLVGRRWLQTQAGAVVQRTPVLGISLAQQLNIKLDRCLVFVA